MKNVSEKTWQLVSGDLTDGAEVLVLKMPTGKTFCEYAPGRKPNNQYWARYDEGFPKADFLSRAACIRDAEKVAGHKLEIQNFEHLKKAVGK